MVVGYQTLTTNEFRRKAFPTQSLILCLVVVV
jgi:hypothetical protein